jgi:hypothetical protein
MNKIKGGKSEKSQVGIGFRIDRSVGIGICFTCRSCRKKAVAMGVC